MSFRKSNIWQSWKIGKKTKIKEKKEKKMDTIFMKKYDPSKKKYFYVSHFDMNKITISYRKLII